MDRQQVACTTYQQRSFYTQFRDGFFGRNEAFNYALHKQVSRWAAAAGQGARALDVCCGRGLMLPLLRYYAKNLGSYTGLDVKASNAIWQDRRVTDGKPLADEDTEARTWEEARNLYYPWPTYFVEGNVAEADRLVDEAQERPSPPPLHYDFIIYTASIEHMHPDDGAASLHALRRVAADGAKMVLTCPNTPEDQDGYDTRYRAHVYEWKLRELRTALAAAGWSVADTWTVDASVATIQSWAASAGLGDHVQRIREHVPPEWVAPTLAPLLPPDMAEEVGLRCVADSQESLW